MRLSRDQPTRTAVHAPLGDGHIVELRTMGPRPARSHPKGTPPRHCNPANGYALNGEPSLRADHGSSEMSFVNSASDQALAVLVRTFPNEAVASANLATLSPLEDSTMMSRSCSPEVRKTCLTSTPSFLASSFAASLRLGASLTARIP